MFGHNKEKKMSFSSFIALAEEVFAAISEAQADGSFAKLESFLESAEGELKSSPSIQKLMSALKNFKL
jgi:hypothetical protein